MKVFLSLCYNNLASNDIWVTCAPILCWALLLAVIVRLVKTMAFSGKYLKIVESGYTRLPVLQLKSPTFPKSLEVLYERATGVSLCTGYFPENVHFIAGKVIILCILHTQKLHKVHCRSWYRSLVSGRTSVTKMRLAVVVSELCTSHKFSIFHTPHSHFPSKPWLAVSL